MSNVAEMKMKMMMCLLNHDVVFVFIVLDNASKPDDRTDANANSTS